MLVPECANVVFTRHEEIGPRAFSDTAGWSLRFGHQRATKLRIALTMQSQSKHSKGSVVALACAQIVM